MRIKERSIRMTNMILMAVSCAVFIAIVLLMYVKRGRAVEEVKLEDYNSMASIIENVKEHLLEIVKDSYDLGLSEVEFEKQYRRRAKINTALKNCVYGIDSAKATVIDLIKDYIAINVPDNKVTELIGLDEDSEPSDHVKFEIIMYRYKQRYGKEAMKRWIKKNGFDAERDANEANGGMDRAYYITVADLNRSYTEEAIKLDIDERREVLAVLIYQQYKGFGIVDTLREMNINGFNMGTSGSILSVVKEDDGETYAANKAVWLYFEGKYIHLRFMDYGSEDELKRIIQLLIRFNNPGPLTTRRGYIVNTMYDKSRILALRPPASEYWAIFVRKFTLTSITIEKLIWQPQVKNGHLATGLVEFLMRGQRTCAVTGRQGSGKTTLLSAIMRFIDPRYNLRILEMAPELYLRELYRRRNILSVQETPTTSAEELQDALKKSDGAVSIVGEVATDSVAARMIQMGMTGSIFTLFTHHANTVKDLILTLRNSLAAASGFDQMKIAEKQVLDVVKFDIHLDYTAEGERYIDRISEVIPIDENEEYPEYSDNDPVNSMNKITAEYYRRQTDRVAFTSRDILKFDKDTHTYYVSDDLTEETMEVMCAQMSKEYRERFLAFIGKYWGNKEGSFENAEQCDKEFKEKGFTGIWKNMGLHVEEHEVNYSALDDNDEVGKAEQESIIDFAEAMGVLDRKAEVAEEFNIGMFDADVYGETGDK